jgi:deoxyadenosine/deoxycytidine kinase
MKTLLDLKHINNNQYEDYLSIWKIWKKAMPFNIDLFVYLKPNIDVCMDRLINRNRNSESSVQISYQEKLENNHNEFLDKTEITLNKNYIVPCLVLNTNQDFKNDTHVQKSLGDKINMFLFY